MISRVMQPAFVHPRNIRHVDNKIIILRLAVEPGKRKVMREKEELDE